MFSESDGSLNSAITQASEGNNIKKQRMQSNEDTINRLQVSNKKTSEATLTVNQEEPKVNWSSHYKLDPSLLLSINKDHTMKEEMNCQHAGSMMRLRRRGVLYKQDLPEDSQFFREFLNSTSATFNSPSSSSPPQLSNSSTYLTKDEARESSNSLEQSFSTWTANSPSSYLTTTNYLSHQNQNQNNKKNVNGQQEDKNDKIFSITSTSIALLLTIITLSGFICLSVSNQTALLVNAQYSNYESSQQQQQQQSAPSSSSSHNSAKLMNRRSHNENNQIHSSHHQPPTRAAKISNRDSSGADAGTTKDERVKKPISKNRDQQQLFQQQQQNSIDRFDSGEQIRPPLLRQPTTLAPLSKAQQVSSNRAYNLQTAASQDSYLSPDEREQVLKQQENHYEGKNMIGDQQAGNDNIEGPISTNERPASNNRWSQPEGGQEHMSATIKPGNHLDTQSSHPDSSYYGGSSSSKNGPSSGGEADEADYDDEPPPNEQQKRANLVPEIRRPTGSASYHQSRKYNGQGGGDVSNQAASQPTSSSDSMGPSEDSDLNDDYGGGNDDVHFSRKSNAIPERASNLNQAASYNQQNRNIHHHHHHQSPLYSQNSRGGYPSGSSKYDASSKYGNNNNNNNEDASDESSSSYRNEPNESNPADKSESGRGMSSADTEEDGLSNSNGGGGGGSSGPDSDSGPSNGRKWDNKFDRRSMSKYNNNNNYHNNPQSSSPKGFVRPTTNVDTGDSDGDSEDPESNDSEMGGSSSAPASAPSFKTEVKSRINLRNINQRVHNDNNNVVPKTSASALNPTSAINPMGSPPAYSLPLSISAPAAVLINTGGRAQQQMPNKAVSLDSLHREHTIPLQYQQSKQLVNNNNNINLHQHNRHNQNNLHGVNHQNNNNIMSSSSHQQKVSANVPYNPQNNPSHAGKYFIN